MSSRTARVRLSSGQISGLIPRIIRHDSALGNKFPVSAVTPTATLSAAGAATGITSSYTYTLGAAVNGGNYTLTVGGQVTANIAWNATIAAIKAALELLSTVGIGGVLAVSNPTGKTYNIVFNDVATVTGQTFSAQTIDLTGGGVSSFGPLPTVYLPVTAITPGSGPNTTNFRYIGCDPYQAGPVAPNRSFLVDWHINSTNGGGTVTAESLVTSTQFELPIKGNAAVYRVLIDDVQILHTTNTPHTGTAQAGTSTTITLAAGASATNGTYTMYDVAITGGTGAGQQKRIVAYDGTSKKARVASAWVTPPDATSVYELRIPGASLSTPAATGSLYNLLFDFGGVRATRRVRVEVANGYFGGIVVGPVDTVIKSRIRAPIRCFVIGDSFVEGTGTYSTQFNLGAYVCDQFGWEPWFLGSGGTGYLNTGTTGRFNILDRVAPPFCSFWFSLASPTGGTFAMSFGGQTTAPIAFNASIATIQAALEALSTVGVGNVTVGGPQQTRFFVLFRNALVNSPNILTIDGTLLTGTAFYVQSARYLGDIKPYLPRDGSGAVLPCVVLFAAGLNDNALDQVAATAKAAAAWTAAQAMGAEILVISVGPFGSTGTPASTIVTMESSLTAQAAVTLRKINGQTPHIPLCLSTVSNRLRTGTGNIGIPKGDGNADRLTSSDTTHPTPEGHEADGRGIAALISAQLGV